MNRRGFLASIAAVIAAPFALKPVTRHVYEWLNCGTSTFNAGDVFTIEGSYAVNPIPRLDCIYGWGIVRGDYEVLITDIGYMHPTPAFQRYIEREKLVLSE